LIVTLKGEAKDARSSSAGMYFLGPNPVNDNPHWLQDLGPKAIWHLKDDKAWVIGLQEELGGLWALIASYDEVAGPQEATNWQYYDGKKWITTSDAILVVNPGSYIIHILPNITDVAECLT
jgi:hypothetical protein